MTATLIDNPQVEVQIEGDLESGDDTSIVDKDSRVQDTNAKGKRRGRGARALKTMCKMFSTPLKLGARTGGEEPTPPSAPGTYTRTVSSIDGSIEYVKVGSQVSRPAQSSYL